MTEPLQTLPACDHGCGSRTARLHFTVPGQISAITPAVDRVTALLRQEWNPEAEKLGDVGLALQEALANAVVHGCKQDPGKSVEVWVAVDRGEGVLLVVRDPGPGFSPSILRDPKSPRQRTKEHGRGIYLICELMDEVHFQRNGSEIHMRKA